MLCVHMIGIVYYNTVMYLIRRTLIAKFQSQTLDTYCFLMQFLRVIEYINI